jgi:hypothetical protein
VASDTPSFSHGFWLVLGRPRLPLALALATPSGFGFDFGFGFFNGDDPDFDLEGWTGDNGSTGLGRRGPRTSGPFTSGALPHASDANFFGLLVAARSIPVGPEARIWANFDPGLAGSVAG